MLVQTRTGRPGEKTNGHCPLSLKSDSPERGTGPRSLGGGEFESRLGGGELSRGPRGGRGQIESEKASPGTTVTPAIY